MGFFDHQSYSIGRGFWGKTTVEGIDWSDFPRSHHGQRWTKKISWWFLEPLAANHVINGWLLMGWWTESLHRKWLEITKHLFINWLFGVPGSHHIGVLSIFINWLFGVPGSHHIGVLSILQFENIHEWCFVVPAWIFFNFTQKWSLMFQMRCP